MVRCKRNIYFVFPIFPSTRIWASLEVFYDLSLFFFLFSLPSFDSLADAE